MRTWLRRTNKRDYMTVLSDSFYPQKCLLRLTPLHREPFGILPKKAGLQTFLHSQAPSQEFSMAFMLRSHNGVHCCGTVGDSHPVHKVDLFSPQQSPNEFDSAFDLRKRSQFKHS